MTKATSCLLATAAAVVIGGCDTNQSVLNPKGPDALQLAYLSWLLFSFGAIVLLLVVLATIVAIRGPPSLRAMLASASAVVWAGAAFPAVTLTGLLGYGVWLTHASMPHDEDAGALHIEVVGEQWWWRIAYARPGDSAIATANEIRIPTGRPIIFTLRSADVIHSFWVPNLGGKLDMIPGRTTRLRWQADSTGIFRGQCAEYCGGPHALMALWVVVSTPGEFETWLEAQFRPAADPVTDDDARGRDLFIAAGCGACHTVRGTSAAGMIGPDLTHLGSRRSVGIDTSPMNATNIARFIRDGQHVKPGNLMPAFRVFTDGELAAVSSYLAGLR